MDKMNAMFARFEPLVHSIFRVITGLLLFQFGVAKLLKFPPVPMFAKVEPARSNWFLADFSSSACSRGSRPLFCAVRWPSPISWSTSRATSSRF